MIKWLTLMLLFGFASLSNINGFDTRDQNYYRHAVRGDGSKKLSLNYNLDIINDQEFFTPKKFYKRSPQYMDREPQNSGPPMNRGPPSNRGPPHYIGPPANRGPPINRGPPANRGPPINRGPPANRGPPDNDELSNVQMSPNRDVDFRTPVNFITPNDDTTKIRQPPPYNNGKPPEDTTYEDIQHEISLSPVSTYPSTDFTARRDQSLNENKIFHPIASVVSKDKPKIDEVKHNPSIVKNINEPSYDLGRLGDSSISMLYANLYNEMNKTSNNEKDSTVISVTRVSEVTTAKNNMKNPYPFFQVQAVTPES